MSFFDPGFVSWWNNLSQDMRINKEGSASKVKIASYAWDDRQGVINAILDDVARIGEHDEYCSYPYDTKCRCTCSKEPVTKNDVIKKWESQRGSAID